jgi:hypothetical protein
MTARHSRWECTGAEQLDAEFDITFKPHRGVAA